MLKLKSFLPWILLVLYGVGAVGFHVAALQPYFIAMVSPFLVITLVLLLIGNTNWSKLFVFWALAVMVYGFGIEWLGVYSGLIFGDYHYGPTLGVKLDGIPLVIGINWLILAYISHDITHQVLSKLKIEGKKNTLIASIRASFIAAWLMVAMDYLIEPVAIWLEFWYWPNDTVPFINYLGWLLVSFVLFFLTNQLNLRWRNKNSIVLYLAMMLFFASLIIASKP